MAGNSRRSLLHSFVFFIFLESAGRTVLKCVDRLVHAHLLDLLDREVEFLSSVHRNDGTMNWNGNNNNSRRRRREEELYQFFGEHTEYPTLLDTVRTLQCAERAARDYRAYDDDGENGNGNANGGTRNDAAIRTSAHLAPMMASTVGCHSLSIDDPVEDETHGQGWYSGRGSPSPPHAAGPPECYHGQDSMGGKIGFSSLPPPSPSSRYNRGDGNGNYYPSRSSKDSSLFRLIVTLQLCLVRIEEADSVLCDGRARASSANCDDVRLRSGSSCESKQSGLDCGGGGGSGGGSRNGGDLDGLSPSASSDSEATHVATAVRPPRWKKSRILALAGVAAGGALALMLKSKRDTRDERYDILMLSGRVALGAATASYIRRRWRIICIDARVADSAAATEDWIFDWLCLVNNNGSELDARYASHKQLLSPRKVGASCSYSDWALHSCDLLYIFHHLLLSVLL
jgi:hypothetical protein